MVCKCTFSAEKREESKSVSVVSAIECKEWIHGVFLLTRSEW